MRAARTVVVALTVLGAVLLAAVVVADEEKSVSRPFAPGGQVRLNLSAGEYTIRSGSDDQILVKWTAETAERLAKARVDLKADGGVATVATKGTRHGVRVVIELPARTDLGVELSAGDLRIEGIEGNKNVGSWAGDIDIDVGNPQDYASVSASVRAGDLTAPAFDVSKGGLFRSFSWTGPGRYTLRVRLTAGDLRLRASREEAR
jgi:hypothetical protein